MTASGPPPARIALRLGAYVLLGVVLFGVTRVLVRWAGVEGPAVPVAALVVALVVLEGLTHVGVLTKPLGDSDDE